MKLSLKDRLFTKKPSQMNQMIDPAMDNIVFKALTYDPNNRYTNCQEFIQQLKAYLNRTVSNRFRG
jgi:serine/threonine protein kinase